MKLVEIVTKMLIEFTYSLYIFQMPLMDLSPFLLLIEAGSTLTVVHFQTPALSKIPLLISHGVLRPRTELLQEQSCSLGEIMAIWKSVLPPSLVQERAEPHFCLIALSGVDLSDLIPSMLPFLIAGLLSEHREKVLASRFTYGIRINNLHKSFQLCCESLKTFSRDTKLSQRDEGLLFSGY